MENIGEDGVETRWSKIKKGRRLDGGGRKRTQTLKIKPKKGNAMVTLEEVIGPKNSSKYFATSITSVLLEQILSQLLASRFLFLLKCWRFACT